MCSCTGTPPDLFGRLVDELHQVSETDALLALLHCLQYTKTLSNGKGALGFAGTATETKTRTLTVPLSLTLLLMLILITPLRFLHEEDQSAALREGLHSLDPTLCPSLMCHVFVFAGARVILIACTQVTVLISGGYIEVTDFQFMFEYALGIIGQNFSLEVTIPDNTTSLHKVLDSSLTIAQPQEELQVKKAKRQ